MSLPTPRLRRSLLPAAALVLAVGACLGPADEDDLFDVEEGDPASTETAVGVTCVGTEACSGAGDVYSAVLRVGATGLARQELAQTFKATLAGTPRRVFLVARQLRPFTSATAPRLRVGLYDAETPAGIDLPGATPVLEGAVDVSAIQVLAPTSIPLSGTGSLVSGQTYVLRVWADAVSTGGTGAVLIGIGALPANAYVDGQASRRRSRRASTSDEWTLTPFNTSPLDVAFSFAGAAGSPCANVGECRSGLLCHEGACVQPNATPLSISPASANVRVETSQTFVPAGGDAPYTFSLVSGGGTLSGATYTAPAATGSAVVRVTDLYGFTADAAITITPANVAIVTSGSGRRWADATYGVSCHAYLNPIAPYTYAGVTGTGTYTIDPDGTGTIAPYDVRCDMTTDLGGWTRFVTITNDASYVGLDAFPNATEFVSNGTFHFSKTQLKASNREVLILETVAPFRRHRYDFKQGSNLSGEDFVGAITGDKGGDVAVWNWVTNGWQLASGSQCNTNNHSQWNCEPENGVRFHYQTRNWMNDGGSSINAGWGFFTGYQSGFGNLAQLVANWNGVYNKTSHDFFVR